MFAGALVGTGSTPPSATVGFTSAHVAYDSVANDYGGMDYATFHKFTYVDAYT